MNPKLIQNQPFFDNLQESQEVEFKSSFNDEVIISLVAFANTEGGTIVLGITENNSEPKITGVNSSEKLVKDFWNQVNNTQKASINILFNHHLTVENIEGKDVIVIQVPMAARQEKPIFINNNVFTGTFRRNADGDYHCSESEVKAMLRDQSEISVDQTTFNDIHIEEIKTDTLRRYRNRFKNLKPQHVWNNLDDDEFLLKIGAVKRDNNMLKPTLAGIVVFAEEYTITNVLPNYFLDYREESVEENIRWSDRVHSNSGTWSGNIFDFYYTIIDKILKSIKLPFALEGISRIDNTHLQEAVREAVANTLIHADYQERQGVVIIKQGNNLTLSNPGNFRISFAVANQGGVSDPRNSTIFKIFSLIGIGERAGSGIFSMNYIFRIASLSSPIFNSTYNPNRTHLSLSWDTAKKSSVKSNEKFGENSESSVKSDEKILQMIELDNRVTIPELSKSIGISTRAVEKQIEKLKLRKKLKRIGPDRGGYWQVINE